MKSGKPNLNTQIPKTWASYKPNLTGPKLRPVRDPTSSWTLLKAEGVDKKKSVKGKVENCLQVAAFAAAHSPATATAGEIWPPFLYSLPLRRPRHVSSLFYLFFHFIALVLVCLCSSASTFCTRVCAGGSEVAMSNE